MASEEKSFENVDGRQTHAYTISSPMCLIGSGELKFPNMHVYDSPFVILRLDPWDKILVEL